MNFTVPVEHRMKINKENEKTDKYLDLAKELEEAVEYDGGSETNYTYCFWDGLQGVKRETGWIEDQRKNQNHPNYSTYKTS